MDLRMIAPGLSADPDVVSMPGDALCRIEHLYLMHVVMIEERGELQNQGQGGGPDTPDGV